MRVEGLLAPEKSPVEHFLPVGKVDRNWHKIEMHKLIDLFLMITEPNIKHKLQDNSITFVG